jgi:lysozyme family protein
MPSISDIINNEIKTEGAPTNDSNDKGGPTAFGISKAANPEAWKNGAPTEAQARAIYQSKYVDQPGFNKITDPQLQAQLVDYGVNSGPMIAIQKLQAILEVPVDGVLGPATLVAIAASTLPLNNLLVVARIRMISKLVQAKPSDLKYLSGWLNRSLEFLK